MPAGGGNPKVTKERRGGRGKKSFRRRNCRDRPEAKPIFQGGKRGGPRKKREKGEALKNPSSFAGIQWWRETSAHNGKRGVKGKG